jgi:hypothetical protein
VQQADLPRVKPIEMAHGINLLIADGLHQDFDLRTRQWASSTI